MIIGTEPRTVIDQLSYGGSDEGNGSANNQWSNYSLLETIFDKNYDKTRYLWLYD